MGKTKFVMEFVLNSCSHSVLWRAVSTPSGLGDWFADEVKLVGEKWVFVFSNKTLNASAKFTWIKLFLYR